MNPEAIPEPHIFGFVLFQPRPSSNISMEKKIRVRKECYRLIYGFNLP